MMNFLVKMKFLELKKNINKSKNKYINQIKIKIYYKKNQNK